MKKASSYSKCPPTIFPLIAFCLMFIVASCSTTKQPRHVETTGFLRDYSELRQGDHALLVYINPQADFAGYDKIILDPVMIWHREDSELYKQPEEELQRLVDYLYTAMKTKLQEDYTIVNETGPGVMRIRAVITEARESKAAMDIVSNDRPAGRATDGVKKLTTGTHTFVGKAAVECEILDSQTNERLAAVVDERAGSKTFGGATGTWHDVYEAFDYWAGRLKQKLAEFRAK